MRLVELVTHGEAPTSRGCSLGSVSPRLAAYRADSVEESASVAGLLAELLLGTEDVRWASAPWLAGEATIATAASDVKLRRAGSRRAAKLTLSVAGQPTSDTRGLGPDDWQQGVPPTVLSAVFFSAPGGRSPLPPLLSAPVAEEFTRLASRRRRAGAATPAYEPRRSDELLRRRDELAARIEALLATRRQESGALDRRLAELDASRGELAEHGEELRRRVRALGDELDAAGARARYEELTRVAAEAEGRQAADQWAPRVEELDEEVARWRATLAELDARESYLRNELARVRPDDAAPQLVLADQRASVAVAQRLVADLEAEVARFARSGASAVCLCQDAHPRLNPLVETLGRHVARLAELIVQQDHALRTQELLAEAAQLDRSQTELRRQLEHLLERRQTLWRSSRARTVRTEAPADYAVRYDRGSVESDHRRYSEDLAVLEAELAALDRERRDVAERRRRLHDAGQLGQWQRELDALQVELSRGAEQPSSTTPGSLRASDVLARLSDGEFNELRLAPGGRNVEARDRSGRIVRQPDLTPTGQQLVGWALRLALADACHAAEVAFPLVLDQPFAELDDRHAANLATCLDDYARRGRQVLVLARRGAGLDRLRGLGVAVADLHGSVVGEPVAVATPIAEPVAVDPQPPAVRTVVREESVERSLILDVDDPIERFPVRLRGGGEAFARARVRTIGDLLGGDPSAIANVMRVEEVTAELVALWQAHLALVCFTPGLDLGSAKLLAECDILSVEELAAANAERLAHALQRRGATPATLDRVDEWVEAAADQLERWRSTGYAASWRRNRDERRQRIRDNAGRRGSRVERLARDGDKEPKPRRERRDRSGERRRSDERRRDESPRDDGNALRFYLDTDNDIEAAPSIGPKRAEQLKSLGVETVAQLLAADPEDVAQRLGDSRVDAATVVAWQHQSGLMCRIPGLRGHDAQVLVGSGFTSAEDIAAMNAADLLQFVDPFCDTQEGQRALRGSARPDLAEVTEWVQGARQRRAVGVA